LGPRPRQSWALDAGYIYALKDRFVSETNIFRPYLVTDNAVFPLLTPGNISFL
jgi:hypothetical protein